MRAVVVASDRYLVDEFASVISSYFSVSPYSTRRGREVKLPVEDPRVESLSEVCKPKKKVYPEITLILEANELPSADVFLVLARDEGEAHGLFDDLRLRDLSAMETRLKNLRKSKKKGDVRAGKLIELLERAVAAVESGGTVGDILREFPEVVDNLSLATAKPVLAVLPEKRDGEGEFVGESFSDLIEIYESCSREEWEKYGEEFGVDVEFPAEIVRKLFKKGNMIVFFTVGSDEVRGWDVRKGTTAVEAAGRIHSDMKRGFIRMEVARWEDVVECGGWEETVKRKKVKLKDRDYVVEDGDVVVVRFNV